VQYCSICYEYSETVASSAVLAKLKNNIFPFACGVIVFLMLGFRVPCLCQERPGGRLPTRAAGLQPGLEWLGLGLGLG
jgi:hypothetical protein